MRTADFDFELPEDRIALRPAEPRDTARMLVVRPGVPAALTDHIVGELAALLAAGDALVINNTRVIPAALAGTRTRNGQVARVTFNLHRRIAQDRWLAFARPAKRLEPDDTVVFGHSANMCLVGALKARVVAKGEAGEVELAFDVTGPVLDEAIAAVGTMPLPPYIAAKRAPDDADATAYQTIYATHDGAVAAPTAGLHFTERMFADLAAHGLTRHEITLHVGAGTFLPVKAEDTTAHRMHAEWGEIDAATAEHLNEVRARGGRLVAVGTTALRLLESAAAPDGTIQPFRGETDIFITPGYRFRAVDVLVTNFHLPRSTLFMLVSAFAGLDVMKAAYAHAISSGYRFYSFGDASLLFRADAPTAQPNA